jgi:hypothetical protein
MNVDPFAQASAQFQTFWGQFQAGTLTRQQLVDAVGGLSIHDGQGRYWGIGVDTGRWIVYSGDQWVEADPYSSGAPAASPPPSAAPLPVALAATAPPPTAATAQPPATPQTALPPPKKGGGGCRILGCGCLGLIALLVVVAIGVFVGLKTGKITQKGLLNAVGQGPGTIEFDNLRDDGIHVSIVQQDSSSNGSSTSSPGSSGSLGESIDLAPFDVKIIQEQNPGKFMVTLQTKDGQPLGTCTLNLRGGDQYQFAALPQRVAVNRANNPASRGGDFVVQTSSLCR